MYKCAVHVCLVPEKVRRRCWVAETGLANSCEMPCECWELTQGPPERAATALIYVAISPDF